MRERPYEHRRSEEMTVEESEDDLLHRVDDSRLTDAIAEARDRAAARTDADLVASGEATEAEIEARRLDRFLAGRERDDAIGFGNAVKDYVDRAASDRAAGHRAADDGEAEPPA